MSRDEAFRADGRAGPSAVANVLRTQASSAFIHLRLISWRTMRGPAGRMCRHRRLILRRQRCRLFWRCRRAPADRAA